MHNPIALNLNEHGYNEIAEVEKGALSALYRAHHTQNDRQVLVRLIPLQGLNTKLRNEIKKEAAALKALDSEAIIRIADFRSLDLRNGGAHLLVSYEGDVGRPLSHFLGSLQTLYRGSEDRNSLFCTLAIQMAASVRDLHRLGLIHRGLNPRAFFLEWSDRRIKLDGFSWNHAMLQGCNDLIDHPDAAEILTYIAPEQTGRMNLSTDTRANLYSLGVLFYEMLTDVLPFPMKHSTEIVYSHIACKCPPPSDVNPDIAPILSQLVLRLLAKHPDDRYQSISGVLHDLKEIQAKLGDPEELQRFELGRRDIHPGFKVPNVLYGRQKEIDLLRNCYDRVRSGGCCLVMIAGETGVGKTELARTISSYVHTSDGILLTGKYDRDLQNSPSTIIKVLIAGMVRWMLTQGPEQVQAWRDKILSAVAPNGQILVDLVPESEHIIGKQPPVCELPPMEARLRVATVLERAASLVMSKEHPLVLFIDDLQWANKESLDLFLGFLLARPRQHLLVLMTYRSNEVDTDSPIAAFLEKLHRTTIPYEPVRLSCLDQSDTTHIVEGIIGKHGKSSELLASVVHAKTGGNPFFVIQFMNALYSNGLIRCDMDSGTWVYDVDQVLGEDLTDNVATLLFDKIKQLAPQTLRVLQAAACVGHRLDPDLLSEILHLERPRLMERLQEALDQGLLRDHEAWQKEEDPGESETRFRDRRDGQGHIEFAHDQIRQTIYQTIPKSHASWLHWKTGRHIVSRNQPENTNTEIFDIVHHLQRGLRMIVSAEEKVELAKLNLLAGHNAIESAFFESALTYLQFAADLLPEDCWTSHYDLSASIFSKLAKCEFVLGNFDASEKIFDILLKQAISPIDKAQAYNAMVVLHTAAGKIDKAMELGRSGLKLLGIKLPHKTNRLTLLLMLIKLRCLWGSQKLSSLVDAPASDDKRQHLTLTLLTNIGLPAFYGDPNLCLWNIARGCTIGISSPERGFPMEHAAFGLITLGAFMGSMFGLHRMGKMYSKAGMNLMERYPNTPNQSIAYFVSAFFNRHWYEPARKNIDYFKRAYRHAIKLGDITYGGHSINMLFKTRIFLGDSLDEIYFNHQRYENFIMSTRSPMVITTSRALCQFYLCLKGRTESPVSMNSDDYDWLDEYRKNAASGNAVMRFLLLLLRLKIFVFYQNWEKAIEITEKIRSMAYIVQGTLTQTEYYFYSSMAAAVMLQEKIPRDQARSCKTIMATGLRRLKRWADIRPENFEPMYELVRAEQTRITGRPPKVQAAYRKAIERARAMGFNQIVAMGCERTGQYLMQCGDSIAAGAYLRESRKYYSAWGATAKAEEIAGQYTGIFANQPRNTQEQAFPRHDFNNIVAALQTISKEIVLSKLLTQLMHIILECTGADHALLITNKNKRLYIEAESRGGRHGDTSIINEPLQNRKESIATSAIYYVERTREMVMMDDIKGKPGFIQLESEDASAPQSLLCLPMIGKNHLVGILYLENTLTRGVFTTDRIEIIKMIAAQAAISFENATLYEHVLKKEQHLKMLSHRLRRLYSELMVTEERERRRIATDLHDSIGHALASAKMGLEEIIDATPMDRAQKLEDVLAVIDRSITDTRTLTFELSPPILYHLGLPAAVDWLCEETQNKHGMAVMFQDLTDSGTIDQKTSVFCFQILRELMFNAVKHAQAKNITVSLGHSRNQVDICIQDDGVGFDQKTQQPADKERGNSFGLFSINERLNLVGGSMTIDASPDQGARIFVQVPCDTPQAAQKKDPQEKILAQI